VYRRRVFNDAMLTDCETTIREMCGRFGALLVESNGEADHVHFLAQYPPLDELAGLLTSVDSTVINARMGYRYPPGAVRHLDDALLAIFGTRYLSLHGNAHREALLRTRLDKLSTPGD